MKFLQHISSNFIYFFCFALTLYIIHSNQNNSDEKTAIWGILLGIILIIPALVSSIVSLIFKLELFSWKSLLINFFILDSIFYLLDRKEIIYTILTNENTEFYKAVLFSILISSLVFMITPKLFKSFNTEG